MTRPAAGSRLGPLLGRWTLAAAAALAGGAAIAGRWVPLLQVPGYEVAMLGCLVSALLGAPLGIAAARNELQQERPSPMAAWCAAAGVLLGLLAALFAGSSLGALVASPCGPFSAAAFFPVLAVPSALLAAALGVACGLLARDRRGWATGIYAVVALASLAASLLEVYRGPAAFAFDPLLGYWPGPIYDDALRIDGRLLFARAQVLALTLLLVAGSELAVRRGDRRAATWPFAALLLAVALEAGLRAGSVAAGYPVTRNQLAAALGGRRDGPRCSVFYPREKRPEEAERLLRDCEFDAAQVARALGIADPPPRPVAVYVYRSDREKRRLVGAAHTDFTKPWIPELHVSDDGWPHPVLRHELVHALAGSFAQGPLRVPARWGVLVSTGVVEGLAMAVDLPRGEWTVHEATRAMRDLGVMPSIERLLGPAGFFSAAPARAYTASGSFIRYLLDRYGPEKVRTLYATVDFERAFGQPLERLAADWSAFLDGVPVPPELRSAAEARFHDPGLLRRICARQVADLEVRASTLWEQGRPAEAAPLWRAAADLSSEPGDLRAEGNAWRAAGEPTCAGRAYQDALTAAGTGRSALRASVEEALGDLDWRAGRTQEAMERYRRALPLASDRSQTRALQAKLTALADPLLANAASGWLLGADAPGVSMARLARSREPLAVYLLGRAFLSSGAPGLARPELAAAASATLPSLLFHLEARRLLAEADLRLGDWKRASDGYLQLEQEADRAADRLRASDDAERCRFEQETYGVPAASAAPSERCGAPAGGPAAGSHAAP
jgi:tetratricopeptide (TPR) repeat protein